MDREERPDLDETYMNVVNALTGRGGWPLSVFLTPDLKPFYGGTYFPPEDRGGLPGFPRLLLALSQAYQQNREQLTSFPAGWKATLQSLGEPPGSGGEPTREAVDQAAQRSAAGFRSVQGGLGSAPKFPHSLEFDFLLHYYHLSTRPRSWRSWALPWRRWPGAASMTSWAGVFIATAWTAAWVVPHFEKMLYDNALLPPLYLAHYQLTGSALIPPHRRRDPGFRPAGYASPRRRLLRRLGRGQRRGGGQILRLEP